MKREARFTQVAGAAAALLMAGAEQASAAAVIVNDGAPDQLAVAPARTPDMAAMSFFLATGETTIGGAVWWGTCGSCSGPDTFEVSFYATSDDGLNLPGALVAGPIAVGQADPTATGALVGGAAEYEYVATFTTPVRTLAAGTEYWFAITESIPTTNPWSLESTSGAPAGDRGAVWNGVSWAPAPGDIAFAFELTGGVRGSSVPEPSTWTMMGLGFAALGLGSRRMTRRRAALG